MIWKQYFKKIKQEKISKKKKKKKREKSKPGAESGKGTEGSQLGADVGAGGSAGVPTRLPCDGSSEMLTPGTGGPLETAHTSTGAQLDSSSLAKRNSVGFFCVFYFFF